MRRRTLATFVATLLAPAAAALLSPAPAAAGLVAPGQGVTVNSFDLTPPGGALLATTSAAFVIDYAAAAGGAPTVPAALAGTLHSSVYREAGGTLTFVYDVDLLPKPGVSGAAEGSELRVGSFAGFATDLSGALDFEDLVRASRSADGREVRLASDTPGLGGPPTLVVRTDATAYDAAGYAGYSAADELSPAGREAQTYFGAATVTGVFRPSAGTVTPPAGPPAAVPLPPAAYSGLGVLLAMGAIAGTRRVFGRTA